MKKTLAGFAVVLGFTAALYAQFPPGGGAPPGPPPTPKAGAPIDLTGYWVSIVTEDWRYRMMTPRKGDYNSVPITVAAKAVADAWDPAKDEAAGEQCKSYGAPALMRVPGRLHVTWQDDQTLKIEMDSGTQTRLFHFTGNPTGPVSWQGYSAAQWVMANSGLGPAGFGLFGLGGPNAGVNPNDPTNSGLGEKGDFPVGPPGGGRGGGRGPAGPRGGGLKVVTTHLRPGYLRKNGVPYSENTVLTEYYDVTPPEPNGDVWLMITTVVDDPQYLVERFITSTHFRKQADASGWDPQPCSAR